MTWLVTSGKSYYLVDLKRYQQQYIQYATLEQELSSPEGGSLVEKGRFASLHYHKVEIVGPWLVCEISQDILHDDVSEIVGRIREEEHFLAWGWKWV